MSETLFTVITSIHPPTACTRHLVERLASTSGAADVLIVGDAKGPASYELDGARLIDLETQHAMPFALASLLPTGHYARKNLGYLEAIRQGADCIYETDDDNEPGPTWAARTLTTSAQPVQPRPWVNVFRLFSDELIWPRGFPLNHIRDEATWTHDSDTPLESITAPVQQGLADNSPDVDAVWRLTQDRPFTYDRRASVSLPAGTWCPVNSQSTWWWPEAYPLMYLPCHCTQRMTDIWRGFVTQRCLWAMDRGLVFHAPEVVQDRNEHDLMRDFEEELPGQLRNAELARRLDDLDLDAGPEAAGPNLLRCYEDLVSAEFFDPRELDLVRVWLTDVS